MDTSLSKRPTLSRAFASALLLVAGGCGAGEDEYSVGADLHVQGAYIEAMHLWRKAADKGNADATYGIGFLYAEGQGVKQDHVRAMHWYRKAADNEDAFAMYTLGYYYELGLAVKANREEAMRWYRSAAKKGDPEAKAALERLGDK